ncbi:type III secretion system chaperone [Variovorax defluvii]
MQLNFHFDPEYIGQRLGAVGPDTENLTVIIQDDDSTWTLAFEQGATVLVLAEWAEAPARLVLSTDIGKPPARRATEVYQAVLSYTTLWRDTGGARIGMAGDEGDLLLLRELDPHSVQSDEFPLILQQFADVAQWWEGFVTSEEIDIQASAPTMAHMATRI